MDADISGCEFDIRDEKGMDCVCTLCCEDLSDSDLRKYLEISGE